MRPLMGPLSVSWITDESVLDIFEIIVREPN
jgi:hypothetical protein